MTDVFVRLAPENDVRGALAEAVMVRIAMESPDFSILAREDASNFYRDWYRETRMVVIDGADFHLASKRKAAELANGEWLLILDDDQLPLYKDWVGYAVSLTKRYPEYAAIAGWSVTNEVPRPAALVEESDSIGCPMIVRREALLDATAEPIDNTARADTIITARLQRHGKTGIARNWRYNHLGMGYSQVIPQHWMPECPV